MKFDTLWKNFPNKEDVSKSCTNKQSDTNEPFSDYCAIMMSECFIRTGISLSSFKANRCWSHEGEKHILLAEDFANGMRIHAPAQFSLTKKI